MFSSIYLIEIGLQKVHFSRILQQPRPVLSLKFLLSEHDLGVGGGVVDLRFFWVDFSIEIQLNVICNFLRCWGTSECKLGWLQVELQIFFCYIRYIDSKIDVISLRIICGWALSPDDYVTVSNYGLLSKHAPWQAVEYGSPSGVTCWCDMATKVRKCFCNWIFTTIRLKRSI